MVVDRQFSEPHLAALYDPLCGREERADFRFYLPLVMAAGAVLDVGCGTDALLHWARECGHTGRLVGLDPARAAGRRGKSANVFRSSYFGSLVRKDNAQV